MGISGVSTTTAKTIIRKKLKIPRREWACPFRRVCPLPEVSLKRNRQACSLQDNLKFPDLSLLLTSALRRRLPRRCAPRNDKIGSVPINFTAALCECGCDIRLIFSCPRGSGLPRRRRSRWKRRGCQARRVSGDSPCGLRSQGSRGLRGTGWSGGSRNRCARRASG